MVTDIGYHIEHWATFYSKAMTARFTSSVTFLRYCKLDTQVNLRRIQMLPWANGCTLRAVTK